MERSTSPNQVKRNGYGGRGRGRGGRNHKNAEHNKMASDRAASKGRGRGRGRHSAAFLPGHKARAVVRAERIKRRAEKRYKSLGTSSVDAYEELLKPKKTVSWGKEALDDSEEEREFAAFVKLERDMAADSDEGQPSRYDDKEITGAVETKQQEREGSLTRENTKRKRHMNVNEMSPQSKRLKSDVADDATGEATTQPRDLPNEQNKRTERGRRGRSRGRGRSEDKDLGRNRFTTAERRFQHIEEEKEKIKRERQEREEIIQKRKRQRAHKKRQHMKQTKSGQPLMRSRMKTLLDKI